MDAVGTISSVIAAAAAVAALWFAIRNSKGNILKRIERKEAQLQKISDQQIRLYGLNGGPIHPITSLDRKKDKLTADIAKLNRKL